MKNEWRVPLTVLMFSSLIFTAVTFMFGVEIDRNTGDMVLTNELEGDEYDSWSYDPMTVVWGDMWRYWCMAGYYGALAVFAYAWFEYMKDEKEVNKNG